MNDKILIAFMIKRAMTVFACNTQKQLADFLGISPEDFSNRKRRGTLTKLIEEKAFEKNINFEWIKTGRGYSGIKAVSDNGIVAEPNTEYTNTFKPHPETSYPDHLVHKTRTVLTSDTVFRRALDSNIEAFHEAVTMKEQLAATKAALSECMDQINILKNEIELLKGDRDKKAV